MLQSTELAKNLLSLCKSLSGNSVCHSQEACYYEQDPSPAQGDSGAHPKISCLSL